MNKPHKAGAAAAGFIFNDEGKVLMQLRTGSNGADTWCPPGGKLDFGEHPVEAFIREVKEETDVEVTDVEHIGFSNDVFEDDGLHFVTIWFVAKLKSGTPKIMEPHKCLNLVWCDLDDMPKKLFQPTNFTLNDADMSRKIRAYREGITK